MPTNLLAATNHLELEVVEGAVDCWPEAYFY